MAFNLSYLFDEVSLLDRIMRNLLTDFEQGRLVPLPTRCYPFEQAGLAHRDVQSGLTIGKCVLTMKSAQPWLTLRSPGTRPAVGGKFPQRSDPAVSLRQHAGIDKHFFRPLRLDRWLEGLQQGNDKLDRFLVTARRVVCELGRGSSELRNLLARPILGDGHGFGHRRHEDGGEVFRAFAAPLGVARDALPEPMFNGWLRSEVFLAQGFDAASMGEIARKAGVSKGLFTSISTARSDYSRPLLMRSAGRRRARSS